MSIGENPHKVHNIVSSQMERFQEDYEAVFKGLPSGVLERGAAGFYMDKSPQALASLVGLIPSGVRSKIIRGSNDDQLHQLSTLVSKQPTMFTKNLDKGGSETEAEALYSQL